MSGVGRRVVIASGLLLLVVVAAFTVLLVAVEDLRTSQRSTEHSQEVLATANELERLVVDLETGQRGFVITGDPQFLDPWYAARTALPRQSRTLEQLVADDPVQRSRARRITQEAASYLSDYSEPLLDSARRDPASARTLAVTEEGRRRMDAIRAQFTELTAAEQTLSAAEEKHTAAVARQALIAVVAGLVGSGVLIVMFTTYLTRAVVRPVLGMATMAQRLAGGDLSARVPESGVGEIRTLEHALNEMAGSLEYARAELAASRTRIVTSADETRRRIERDLHDGIQQRLVSLALDLRAVEASGSRETPELRTRLNRVVEGLEGALEDLREISRGIHPAILSEGGLGPAIKVLARRSAIPVEVDLELPSRLPPSVEVGAYYVVSEALTNAVKHAGATVAQVSAHSDSDSLQVSVRDDGRGGADPAQGTGLIGLTDRVEALGGTISIHSPSGEGTTLTFELPVVPT